MENLDVEAGICISKKLCNSGQIECAAVRPEKGASGLFLGPYEQSDPLMNEIKEWIKSNGYKSKGVIFNYFLNDTARAQEELLTKIAIPVDRE
jgi:effector-binding domain-containing protein